MGTAFIDFTGCFALTCSRPGMSSSCLFLLLLFLLLRGCGCAFCAWCNADCGDNAHNHVVVCPFKLNDDEDYYGKTEQFQEATRRRQMKMLREYLQSIKEKDILDKVLEALKPFFRNSEFLKEEDWKS